MKSVVLASWVQAGVLGALLAVSLVPAQARSADPAEAVRSLIVESESESGRDLPRATQLAERAIEQAEALGDLGLTAYARLTRADALLKARRIDEAETELQRVESSLGVRADSRVRARLLVLRARALRDRNQLEAAEVAFQEAERLGEQSGDEGLFAIILNSHAAMLWRSGDAARAEANLTRALEINQRLGREGEATKNLSYLSLIARDRGDFDLAQRLNTDIMAIAERRGDLKGVAVAANTIGQLLAQQGEYRRAEELFVRAAEAYRQLGDPTGEGPALANRGTTLVKLGQFDEAAKVLLEAVALAESTKDATASEIARTALAQVALSRDDIVDAEHQANLAMAAARSLPQHSPNASALSVLAEVRIRQGRRDEAIAHLREALEHARAQNRVIELRDVLVELGAALSANGQHAEAYQLQLEATDLIRQMRDAELRREVARIESEFSARQRETELDAQKQRIALLEQQATQQRSIRFLLGLALGVAALLVMALVSRMLLRRRNELQLQAHNLAMGQVNRELADAADTDALTRARNRRYLHRELLPALQARITAGQPFALALIDADYFKSINDTYGHDVGDHALQAIADAWHSVLGPGDTLVRFGGEEFLVVRLESSVDTEGLVRRGMAATRACAVEGLRSGGLSVSVGWLSHPWPADANLLLQIADRALLLAKREGRDRAVGVRCVVPPRDLNQGNADELLHAPGIELLRHA